MKPTDGILEAIARGQNGLVTADQARMAGATDKMVRHRLETRRWVRIHPGVFTLLGASSTPVLLVHAAVLAAGAGSVASHTTAAGLLGIPGFAVDGRHVHVTTPSYTRRRRTPAQLHGTLRLLPDHCRTIAAVPCTSVARTIFDLCGDLHPGRAERALDSALARRLVVMPALWRVLEDLAEHGRAGSALLRRLLTARRGRYAPPESELETRFVELVRSVRLPEPERQVDLGDADAWIGRVDFVYRTTRLVIECDGALAHSSLLDRRSDAERDRRLIAAGWTVLRFSWVEVAMHPAHVAERVRRAQRAVYRRPVAVALAQR